MSARTFTVLSRRWCHLCHELIAALGPVAARYGWRVEEIDVDADPVLEARWDEHVPVLFAGGVEICRHRFDADAVHAFCAAFPLKSGAFPG